MAVTWWKRKGQGRLSQNQHHPSLWAIKIMLFPWNVQLHSQERTSSLHTFEALSCTTIESWENSNALCTFNQHFKSNPLKKYGKWDGRVFVLYQAKVWQDKWNLFLLIYFWNQSVYKPAFLFWSYNHHLEHSRLMLSWGVSLSYMKKGRMEGFLWRGCRGGAHFHFRKCKLKNVWLECQINIESSRIIYKDLIRLIFGKRNAAKTFCEKKY